MKKIFFNLFHFEKKIIFAVFGLLMFFVPSIYADEAASNESDDTKSSGFQGCERHFQSAVKFIVDTPVAHPFTVNENGGQIIFSRGNLQYCPARDEWRFALRQFDRVGNGKAANPPAGTEYANPDYGITTVFYDSIDYSKKDATGNYVVVKGVPCNNLLVSKKYQGWIDWFSWGTSGLGRKVGDKYASFFYPYDMNNSVINTSYNRFGFGPSYWQGLGEGAITADIDRFSGTNQYFDWGYGNYIREYSGCSYAENGAFVDAIDSTMYFPEVWRTLTADEWTYLLITRKVGDNDSAFSFVRLKFGKQETDTVTGMVIYPDDFSFSEAGVVKLPFGADYDVTEIDATIWEAMEKAGCVFLPGAGHATNDGGVNSNEEYYGINAPYWSATAANDSAVTVRMPEFNEKKADEQNINRNWRFAVRLVQDYDGNFNRKVTIERAVTHAVFDHKISNTYTYDYGSKSVTLTVNATNYPENKQLVYNDTIKSYTKTKDTLLYINKLTVNIKHALFSIAYGGAQAYFCRGNLQHQASTNKWRFAPNQYDMCKLSNPTSTTSAWNDYFGWGTSNQGTDIARSRPWLTNKDGNYGPADGGNIDVNSDESHRSYDWGYKNQITWGGITYPANTWRTPTRREWAYIATGRSNHEQLRSHVVLGDIKGIILYPDGFQFADANIEPIPTNDWTNYEITMDTWKKLEQVGAIFLPKAGNRNDKNPNGASYWTSTYYKNSGSSGASYGAYKISFSDAKTDRIGVTNILLYWGYNVRLIRNK